MEKNIWMPYIVLNNSLTMRHSEDNAVHKIPHKMKPHWQNQMKILVPGIGVIQNPL